MPKPLDSYKFLLQPSCCSTCLYCKPEYPNEVGSEGIAFEWDCIHPEGGFYTDDDDARFVRCNEYIDIQRVKSQIPDKEVNNVQSV